MATPHEKLAASLEILRPFQKRGAVVVRSRELTRTHRERLIQNGFLREIIKGWYLDEDMDDRQMRNALAARGYWQAYQSVRRSVRKVLEGDNPGTVCEEDHRDWYREMFGPEVAAGLITPADLAGYRNDQVFIRRSRHVPPRYEAVRDCMPSFFDLLRDETQPSVRIVLGHFIFVYIHPYMDGNGRMGRFLMNVMLASGGYPWTVIPVEKRGAYMDALESASVKQNILPFARFLGGLLDTT